jgi:hypothetical protein
MLHDYDIVVRGADVSFDWLTKTCAVYDAKNLSFDKMLVMLF